MYLLKYNCLIINALFSKQLCVLAYDTVAEYAIERILVHRRCSIKALFYVFIIRRILLSVLIIFILLLLMQTKTMQSILFIENLKGIKIFFINI